MRKKQILIADDSPAIRKLLRSVLNQRERFAICGEAVDGQDAVEKAQCLDPDVVLLDLDMPIMNGAEAAGILRKSNPHAHLVLFTMYGDAIGGQLASAVGVERVIAKQGGLSELIECLDSFPDREPDQTVH
jgi:DNA-binding NarL/FixJ family response regulator